MRCPKCRTLTLLSASETREAGSLVRCPRCPAAWVVRRDEDGMTERPIPPPMTRRGPLIIEGKAGLSGDLPREPLSAVGPEARVELRRYGIAAGAAALMLALVAVVMLAPNVSALPGIALLEGSR
jgi:predicted Zn finger-like uncharacterized protein